MASCLISQGWDCPDCTEKFNVPGLEKDEVFIANHTEILAYASVIPGEISGLTFEALKGFKKICFHKDTSSWGEELVPGTNAGSHYTQNVTGRTIDFSTAIRNAIDEYVDVDTVIVVKGKGGKFWLVGEDGGLTLSENIKNTGAASGDDTGDSLIWSGLGLGKVRQFLLTDEATTQALLDGLVV